MEGSPVRASQDDFKVLKFADQSGEGLALKEARKSVSRSKSARRPSLVSRSGRVSPRQARSPSQDQRQDAPRKPSPKAARPPALKSKSEVLKVRLRSRSNKRAAPAQVAEEKKGEPWLLKLRLKRETAAARKKAEKGKGEQKGKGSIKSH